MTPRRFITVAIWLVALATAPARAGDLDAVLTAAMDGTKVPAMGILILRDGKVAGEAVQGVRRSDQPDAVRLEDVWHIGSDGKAMTATLIARLVDRKVLSWDAPLEKMLPDLAQTMRPEYRSVTLTQLLSHRSGLPHDLMDEAAVNVMFADRSAVPLDRKRALYIAAALKDPPVAPPGSAFSYSNTGYIVAAAIAERATGVTYETLMRREVFDPLGMTSVGFGVTQDGQPIGHHGGRPIFDPIQSNPPFFAPAGNIYLSLADWARFCLDQMAGANGRGALLTPASYQLMQTAQPGGEVGLGWGVLPSLAGHPGPVLEHAGSDGNWYAVVALFPRTGAGVLVAANAGDDMDGDKADRTALKAALTRLGPAS
jgi:CubicO group peptidase (beta-lactamase class C family)